MCFGLQIKIDQLLKDHNFIYLSDSKKLDQFLHVYYRDSDNMKFHLNYEKSSYFYVKNEDIFSLQEKDITLKNILILI